jgi:hypothetical protein
MTFAAKPSPKSGQFRWPWARVGAIHGSAKSGELRPMDGYLRAAVREKVAANENR